MAILASQFAFGTNPTAGEIGSASSWWEAFFSRKSDAPFSFVIDGKPSSEYLKGCRKTIADHKAKGRLVRTLVWHDKETGLLARCVATRFEGSSAFEWVVYLENKGSLPTPIIKDLQAWDGHYAIGNSKLATIHRSLGDHNSADSFRPIETQLKVGDELVLSPHDGKSSDPHMPFLNLETEPGSGMAVGIGWSGQWQAVLRRQEESGVSVKVGQQLTHFKLLPGESVRTPRMLLVFWKGTDPLRGNNLLRQVLMAHYLVKRKGKPVISPICACVNWTAPDGSYEKPHLDAVPVFKRLGVEVYWSDMDPNHWYPGGFPGGTGNYTVDKAKYPNGLEQIGEKLRQFKLPYLLWFEPERAAPNTDVDKQHPEFLLKPNENGHRLFNLGDPKARNWMIDNLDGFVKRLHLGWIRQDFNIGPLGFWRWADAPDRQGITENHYITGLYTMWDELIRRNPGLVIDLCAGGGRRIDIEVLQRGVPLWHSDLQCDGPHETADQLQNAGLWRWVPYHGSGNFGLEPSYAFRSSMTTGNIMAVSGPNNTTIGDAHPDLVKSFKRSVAMFNKLRPLMAGDFYPLFPHSDSDEVWFGYQFHRPDLDAGVVVLFRRPKSLEPRQIVALKGLGNGKAYVFTDHDTGRQIKVEAGKQTRLEVWIDNAPDSKVLFYKAAP